MIKNSYFVLALILLLFSASSLVFIYTFDLANKKQVEVLNKYEPELKGKLETDGYSERVIKEKLESFNLETTRETFAAFGGVASIIVGCMLFLSGIFVKRINYLTISIALVPMFLYFLVFGIYPGYFLAGLGLSYFGVFISNIKKNQILNDNV